jgi:ABC-type multidrug transport system ATPase subunit
VINIEGVTMRFGRTTAVDGVSLDIPAGDSVALWGSNGAGKTTLIRCALGLLRFKGRIAVGGHDVQRDGKSARLLVGYVPQELGFYDELGVGEAIRYFARLKGVRDASPREALAGVGLTGHEAKRVRELSGGMKQRLALAIALLGDPPVLVLDEVTASLDAVGRGEFVHLLERLAGTGRTLLFASHRMEEVATLARRVVVLERGRVARVEPCQRFLAGLGHAAALHIHLHASVRDQAFESLQAGGFAPMRNGVGLVIPVRPEQKAAPFRVLAEARITVDDFEIVSAVQAAELAAHRATTELVP